MTRPILFACALAALLAPPAAAQRSASKTPAPGELAALAAKCGSGVMWKANDPRLLEEGSNREEVSASRTAAKDFDRTEAMNAALAAARESHRPVFWYVPRITAQEPGDDPQARRAEREDGHQMYRPAVLDGYVSAALFSEPECVEALNRRFVCVRLACDPKLGKRFGIEAPVTVEPAFVFLEPDGKVVRVVHSLRSFNPAWFLELLHGVLASRPKLAGPSKALQAAKGSLDATPAGRAAFAQECLSDLAWDEAIAAARKAIEQDPKNARAHAILARALWRSGHAEDALGALDGFQPAAEPAEEGEDEERPRPRRRGTAGGGAAEIACEKGRILLFLGKLDAAAAEFQKVRSGARKAEAQFHLGLCEWFSASDTMALRRWKEAAAAGADGPFGWRAAANLIDGADRTPAGPVIHGFEDPFRPVKGAEEAATSAVPRAEPAARDVAKDAVEYLLRLQRENGGFTDSRYAYWPTPDLTPNAWVAATAVSCAALLEWRDLDPERIDEALRRGEAYAFDERHMNRGFNEEIYADGYKLLYLARKHDFARGEDARKLVVEKMNGVVRHLERTQVSVGGRPDAQGFWAHEYPNPFCTAAVMNGLALAKERGATVPASMMTAGAEALLSVRSKDGAFSYGAGRMPQDEKISDARREDMLKNSMARSPVCEAAVIWAGHEAGTQAKLAAAMDNFWKFLPRFEKVRRCDFHTDGELAGFFWWHAIFHTTEAVKAMPAAAQEAERRKLLELVLRLGELDGSFIDSHEMGKSYGTAMGLLSLKNLLKERNP